MKICVLGAGAWGTALAVSASSQDRSPHALTLWARDAALVTAMQSTRQNQRYLPGAALPESLQVTGGGKGYRPVDHSKAIDRSGGLLAEALKAAWLPKVTAGWFFKAESFFSVARYLDEAAIGSGPPPDFLSHSHGEGFLRFFQERCQKRGIYLFDEPESALSPTRQIEFLKLLCSMQASGQAQVIMATHSPLLMACPGASLIRLTKYGHEAVRLEDTEHFRVLREFFADPELFVASMVEAD